MRKKKTTEEFKDEVFQLTGKEYLVLNEYTGVRKKIKMKHNISSCQYEYEITPESFLRGTRCAKCAGNKKKTTEEFRQEVYNLVKDEYIILNEYKNAITKIKMKHNIPTCNYEYEISPNKFLNGTRCLKCAKNKKKTTEEFKQEVYDLVKDEYIVLDEYKNNATKINMKHNTLYCQYEYKVTPDKFLQGNRCPKCSGLMKKTTEGFRKEIYNLVKDEYIVLDEYINSGTKIKFKHNISNCQYEYEITPNHFLRGSRCPKCSGLIKKTTEQFKQEVYDLVKDEYTVLTEYINSHCLITLQHNKKDCQHIYTTRPYSFLQNVGRCPKCNQSGTSKMEKEILLFLKEHLPNEDIIENDRTILNGKEIDILIPSKNIGIEFNGLYWHSSQYKDKRFHLEKTQLASLKNIRLIHIFEDEWVTNQKIIELKLLHILNINNLKKIYARKCSVQKIIKISDKTQFLNETHIQGADRSNFSYGLYYEDELVALMSFIKPRINMGRKDSKDGEYELSRYSTKYNVIGGFGKLLKHIIKNENIKEIYTYADLRWTGFDSNVYLKNNFKYVSTSEPNYWYVINNERKSRFNYQKGKLKELFPDIYDDNKTEEQIMLEAGYYRIYDCGNLKFSLKND